MIADVQCIVIIHAGNNNTILINTLIRIIIPSITGIVIGRSTCMSASAGGTQQARSMASTASRRAAHRARGAARWASRQARRATVELHSAAASTKQPLANHRSVAVNSAVPDPTVVIVASVQYRDAASGSVHSQAPIDGHHGKARAATTAQ